MDPCRSLAPRKRLRLESSPAQRKDCRLWFMLVSFVNIYFSDYEANTYSYVYIKNIEKHKNSPIILSSFYSIFEVLKN
jgi:hypothetical protein